MTIPIIVENRHTIEELRDTVKRTTDEMQKTRIKVIIDIKKGKKRSEVAETFVCSRNSIRNWVNAYNKKGIEGLGTNKGGRPEGNPKWDREIFDGLLKETDKQDQYWSVPKMIEWIRKHEKKDIPYNTVWYRLQKLGYPYKPARPHPCKGNKERQDAFKKGA